MTLYIAEALASVTTHPVHPLLRRDGTFNPVDMRRQSVIVHDAPFLRLDFCQGDNRSFQLRMFRAVIDYANSRPVITGSLARTYVRCNRESKAGGASSSPLHFQSLNLL